MDRISNNMSIRSFNCSYPPPPLPTIPQSGLADPPPLPPSPQHSPYQRSLPPQQLPSQEILMRHPPPPHPLLERMLPDHSSLNHLPPPLPSQPPPPLPQQPPPPHPPPPHPPPQHTPPQHPALQHAEPQYPVHLSPQHLSTQPPLQHPPPHFQHWNWEGQQYLPGYSKPVGYNVTNHGNLHSTIRSPRLRGYPMQRRFGLRGRYPNNGPFPNHFPPNWQRPGYKRTRTESSDSEPKSKSSKKKKKPLSQSLPSRISWTYEEAANALNLEKEYNKRSKSHSLIIKFPDAELNKEIVTKFNPAIENVHFQQPSTARFCFVTLKETANPEEVISQLNEQKFGSGHLIAEYKRDREEDLNIGPDDIDPLTLYVGNLSQEITKDDLISTFAGSRRIDIGYAKKMKYTRYAFISFTCVADAIKGFYKARDTQLHSKSLIVRFRRLHGTVGMPGESKVPKRLKKPTEPTTSENTVSEDNGLFSRSFEYEFDNHHSHYMNEANNAQIKKEPTDDEDVKPFINSTYKSPFAPGPIEALFEGHRPKIIKTEGNWENIYAPSYTNVNKKPYNKTFEPVPAIGYNDPFIKPYIKKELDDPSNNEKRVNNAKRNYSVRTITEERTIEVIEIAEDEEEVENNYYRRRCEDDDD
ncbi:RNA binding protein, partial [Oryctes borbonicus]